ncbi:MAG: BMP family ABC transporter substrate-binding protein [Defluviitaleaceae bacterium]|nr:BMP family ABC transporter substrate-binding protein [Defluviitaleaceae bacterium]
MKTSIVKTCTMLALLMLSIALLTACSDNDDHVSLADATFDNVRLAFIHVGGLDDQGYTYRQHRGTLDMAAALGIDPDTQIRNFMNTAAGDVPAAIAEAMDWGAHMIFGTSFGFGGAMREAAEEHPDVIFLHATGNMAVDAGLPNFHNYFGNMSQARYLSGIAAGLKTESNILGFVGAHPNAEVITGLNAFFLGARSVNPDVTMNVMFTNYWNNPTRERQVADALIATGADVLAQHADSPATQLAAQEAGVWSVGYNNDMIPAAPYAVLVSPMFDWSVYLIYAVRNAVEGRPIRTDVLYGINDGMVFLSPLNPATVAPGTVDAIVAAETQLRAGRNIFTGPLYDNDGNQILADGVQWIERLSAPSWTHYVEGINVIGD